MYDMREIDILGRILQYETWGCSWKADPRHKKMILAHFGFNDVTKSVTTTGVKEVESEGGCEQTPLTPTEATEYRAVAARLNYMAADWPNVQFAAKEVCRRMSNPDVKAHERLKRLARYLVGL